MKTRLEKYCLSRTLMIFLVLLIASCTKSDISEEIVSTEQTAAKNLTGSATSVVVPFFIEDAAFNNPVTGNNTSLYTILGHNPVLAPDDHHITLGEFNQVSGTAEIKCLNSGTQVKIHLSNLIPNGIYTIWSLTFQSPGFDGTLASFVNLTGVGALGANDGSSNTFVASASGEGQITRIVPAGNLSVFGSIGNCILTDEYEVHFVGVYHIDGLTYGPVPGPDGTLIEHFGFIFRN